MRKITTGFIHCSATQPQWMAGRPATEKAAEIDRWHRSHGWDGFGYHGLIDRDGTFVKGRPDETPGAHARGHNDDSVSVVLVGGHGSNENDRFRDHYTEAQEQALLEWIDEMRAAYPGIKFRGHNEVAAKACPGFRVKDWLKGAEGPRKSIAQSKTVQASVLSGLASSGGVASILGALDPVAQYIVLGFLGVALLMLGWVIRERVKKWLAGDR